MPDVARSSQFDDVYFSKKDGLAETQHVFLDGSDLPHCCRENQAFLVPVVWLRSPL